MPLPTYLYPWRRLLRNAALLGLVAGAALSVALVGAERTSGVVALAQAVLAMALIWIVFYVHCRIFLLILRRWFADQEFARTPHLYPELFALFAVFFMAAAALAVGTWAVLGRGFLV